MHIKKRGRRPLVGAACGVVVAAVGAGWTFRAIRRGAPVLFALGGVLCVGVALVYVVYQLFTATQRDPPRALDLPPDDDDDDLGPTPGTTGRRLGAEVHSAARTSLDAEIDDDPNARFCPTCGARLFGGEDHCPYCGTRF